MLRSLETVSNNDIWLWNCASCLLTLWWHNKLPQAVHQRLPASLQSAKFSSSGLGRECAAILVDLSKAQPPAPAATPAPVVPLSPLAGGSSGGAPDTPAPKAVLLHKALPKAPLRGSADSPAVAAIVSADTNPPRSPPASSYKPAGGTLVLPVAVVHPQTDSYRALPALPTTMAAGKQSPPTSQVFNSPGSSPQVEPISLLLSVPNSEDAHEIYLPSGAGIEALRRVVCEELGVQVAQLAKITKMVGDKSVLVSNDQNVRRLAEGDHLVPHLHP